MGLEVNQLGVADNFKRFCSNLYVDNASSISLRYKLITKRLNIDFWDSESDTYHSRYVGSYGRDTAIRNFHDLDMLFQLPSKYYHQYDAYTSNGQSALLQAFRASLQKTYPSTSISGDGQVAVICFTDAMRFEILPAFKAESGAFIYPDSNNGGRWKTTNPMPEISAIKDGNETWNKNLKRLCRMVRAWKIKNEVPMGGLLIDTFAYSFLSTWQYRGKSFLYYDLMMHDFFKYLSERDKTQSYWLAVGSRQYIYRKGSFENKAKTACILTSEAIDYENRNYPRAAANKWREVFGTLYPSYESS